MLSRIAQCLMFACATLVELASAQSSTNRAACIQWTSRQIDDFEQTLRAKVDDTQAAHEQLTGPPGPTASLFYWAATREGEVHEKSGDLGIVRNGEGAVWVGGTLEPKSLSHSGDVHGSVTGGTRQPLGPGDLFYIPAKMPHRWEIASGKHLYIQMIKVELDGTDSDSPRYLYWSSRALNTSGKKGIEQLISFGNVKCYVAHRPDVISLDTSNTSWNFWFIRQGELGLRAESADPASGTNGERRLTEGDLFYMSPSAPKSKMIQPNGILSLLVVQIQKHLP